MRIFRSIEAAQSLLRREELAALSEDGRMSLVYRDDTSAVVRVGGDMWWRGGWNGGMSYRPGDLVTRGGRGFVAKTKMTASSPVEPGVTGGWTASWDALAAS